jgi:hypothetical protein
MVEDFFAVIGFLTVVGLALWYWNKLNPQQMAPSGRTVKQEQMFQREMEARNKKYEKIWNETHKK